LSTLAYDYQGQKRFAEAERVFLLIRDMRLQEVNARYADALGNAWHRGMRGLLRVYDEANRPQDYDATAERLTAYYDREHANSPSARCDYSLNEELADHYEKRRDFNRADGYWKKRIAACEARTVRSARALAASLSLSCLGGRTVARICWLNERHGRCRGGGSAAACHRHLCAAPRSGQRRGQGQQGDAR
jgi:hypothetical protein